MSDEFSILHIEPDWRRDLEPLGSKPKFWFRYQDEDWLFKEVRENTGEHWAEKVSSEIGAAIGLPTHRVELAEYESRRGCAVRSFLEPNNDLVHGNELLGGSIEGYDKDKIHGQADHNFANIFLVLEKLSRFYKRDTLLNRFIGYILLDALVGNTDRHHENWGLLVEVFREAPDDVGLARNLEIAPTFDHASSLGRELLDEKRSQILDDPNAIRRYINKARGGIFKNSEAKKGLSPMKVAEYIASKYPTIFREWQENVEKVDVIFFQVLIEHIPEDWMSEVAKEFVLAFLSETRNLILCIK